MRSAAGEFVIQRLRPLRSQPPLTGSAIVCTDFGDRSVLAPGSLVAKEAMNSPRTRRGKYVERRAYDPEGLYWYGKCLLASGHLNDARQQFEQCREAVETMQPNRRRQLAKWKRMARAELKDIEKTPV